MWFVDVWGTDWSLTGVMLLRELKARGDSLENDCVYNYIEVASAPKAVLEEQDHVAVWIIALLKEIYVVDVEKEL